MKCKIKYLRQMKRKTKYLRQLKCLRQNVTFCLKKCLKLLYFVVVI